MLAGELIENGAFIAADRSNRITIIVVVRVDVAGNGDLVKIALAGRKFCFPLGRRQRRQQQRRQDGDDGDDHQQFDESKAASRNPFGISYNEVHWLQLKPGFFNVQWIYSGVYPNAQGQLSQRALSVLAVVGRASPRADSRM